MIDYFINSSHNTYLCGHQLYGESSQEMYKEAMSGGYRLVELDCYDGKDNDINVTHGYTLVDKVKLDKVLEILRDNAFQKNDLPVILSVENHLSSKYQEIMAAEIKRIFGKSLYILDENNLPEDLPPLKTMRGCFIIKAGGARPKGPDRKKVKPRKDRVYPNPNENKLKIKIGRISTLEQGVDSNSVDNGDEMNSPVMKLRAGRPRTIAEKPENKEKTEEQIREEIEKMQENSVFIKSLLVLRGFIGTSFYYEKLNTNNYQTYEFVTLKSPKFEVFMKDEAKRKEIIKFSSITLMKAYPQRFDSINYDPTKVWILGGQVAALNIQSLDEDYTMMNKIFFLQNRGCGYVLKPKKLLPESMYFDSYSNKKGEVHIKIYNLIDAFDLILKAKKEIKDKYNMSIIFKLYGSLEDDKNEEKSIKVSGSLYEPTFSSKDVSFNIYETELSFIVVKIEYQGSIIGRSAIPLCLLKEGLRRVSLYDLEQNESDDAAIIIFIKKSGFEVNY